MIDHEKAVRIIGVFVGEWVDGQIFVVLHGEDGSEYLSKGDADSRWEIVSLRHRDGDEVELEVPVPAPHPVAVAQGLLRGGDEFTLALDKWRSEE